MSNNTTKTALNTAVETEPTVPLSPDEIVRALRTLRERMVEPEEMSITPSQKSRLAHVDANFVQAAVNATGVSDVAQRALGRTDKELRKDIDVAARWSAVADELRAMLKLAVALNTVRRQKIGLAALQTYQICRQLARDPRNSQLDAHIEEMKRLNKFGRTRRKAQPAAIQPPKQ